jgi:hypothetical protein
MYLIQLKNLLWILCEAKVKAEVKIKE